MQENNPIRFTVEMLFSEYRLDALWVKNLVSIKYLAGFTGSTANLLIEGNQSKLMMVDSRYTIQAGQECAGSRVIEITKPLEDLAEQVVESGYKRLGFEANQATYADVETLKKLLPNVELVAVEKNLANLRVVKSSEEIEKLKTASKIANIAFSELLEQIQPGWTEKEAAWFLEKRFRENGATGLSFDTLVCSGARAAIVHGKPSDKKIEKGELIIVDRGLVADHFCSDETNTLLMGKADDKQKEIYQIVLDAHDKCIESIKPGRSCIDIDAVARDYIREKGYGDYFGHGTGHGIGLEVHEQPMISPRGQGIVEEGMVFSVEPGIYIPEWGGVRIEDLVVVTSDGCEVITRADKKRFELER